MKPDYTEAVIRIHSDGRVEFIGQHADLMARIYETKMYRAAQSGEEKVVRNLVKSFEKLAKGL